MIEAAGGHAPTENPIATDFGEVDVATPFLQVRRATIYGGSSEIQRNVVARRVLNLPNLTEAIDGHGPASDIGADFVARQRRQIHRAAGPKVARGFREQDPSFAPARLREAGELGWLGILVPDSANGLGLGLTELALVLEQAGRGLVCEPIGLAAISAAALAQGRAPHPMLERVMSGAALVVPALQEGAHGDDPLVPRTQAAGTAARSV